MDSDSASSETVRRNRSPGRMGCVIAVCLGIGLVIVLLLVPAFQRSSIPSRRTICLNNMHQLSMALMNYQYAFGSFPPACTYDKDGKPMHSWRVLLLPFLEQGDIYAKYDFNQPWNSPHNWKLIERVSPSIFRCPSTKGDPGETNYLAVVGDETAWPTGKGISADSIKDGASQTILLVEVANSGIHWAEPRDLPFAQALQGVNPPHSKLSISGGHSGGVIVTFCDGHLEFLPNSTSVNLLRALLTRNGGEPLVRTNGTGEFELSPRGTEVEQE
jgi:prepilin-type processing-associated H-X9-DG protein